jgi:hypothetical protein
MGIITGKAALVAVLSLVVGSSGACGQAAADFVGAGRRLLATNDLRGARDSFTVAATLAPSDASANVLAGATRVLCLAEQPAGKAVLMRLGLTVTNHGLCGWMVCPGEATANAAAGELTAVMGAKALEELSAGAASLARIGDTNFTLLLTSNETTTAAVTTDYGDLLILRSGFELGRYACYALQEQGGDKRAAALRFLVTGRTSGPRVENEEFETLLNLQTSSDGRAEALAVSNAIALYLTASDFIRSRATNDVRLFNYDPRMADAEGRFRERLKILGRSMEAAARKRFGG